MLCWVALFSVRVSAQLPDVKWGAGASGGALFNFSGKVAPNFAPWGLARLWIAHIIKGQEESSLSLLLKTGFAYHNVSYLSLGTARIGTDHARIFINPEAMLPLWSSKVSVSLGFGLDYTLATRVWVNGVSSNEIMSAYYYGNLEQKERRLIPFLSCGVQYRTGTSFSVLLLLQQYLQNAYYRNERLDLGLGGTYLDLVHKPFCMQFGLLYHFSKS